MPGNYQQHLEDYGMCQCSEDTGTIAMNLESQDERTGRWKAEKVPACERCYGLK